MIDPIKTAYIAGYMTCATWEDGDEREYLERLAEEMYESDVKDNWYRLGEAVDKVSSMELITKACRGTQMDDAGIRNVQEMSAVVNAAIKWWWAQEKSDTEYHNAEHELSATVGKYCVRNKL